MGIIQKAQGFLSRRDYGALFSTARAYLNYLRLSLWFHGTGRSLDPDLKKTNKNWIIYTYLRHRYRKFLAAYPVAHTDRHEYGNTVWWCWLQGEQAAPAICRACLASVRAQFTDKTITVITSGNLWDYTDFPEYIKEKYRRGIISPTHFSDLLRLQLLTRYGGIWIDATVYCTRRPGFIGGRPLFMFKTQERNDPATVAQNWFISAEKNEPILCLTRDFLFEYWKEHSFAIHYFIFYFFMKIAAEAYPDEWRDVPFFSDVPCHILQRELNAPYSAERFAQIAGMTGIHKLSYKLDAGRAPMETFYSHIIHISGGGGV